MKTSVLMIIFAFTAVSVFSIAQPSQPMQAVSTSYKEAQWLPAQTPEMNSDASWWAVYHDARLNELEQPLSASNLELKVAESRFQQVLILDPYNADANALLKTLNKQRIDYAQGSQEQTRVHRLWEVSDRWTPPISSSVQPPKSELPVGPIVRDALRQQSIIVDILPGDP